jgi:hypothetical protein
MMLEEEQTSGHKGREGNKKIRRRRSSLPVKVKLSLCSEHHATKAYWGTGCIAPCIFDLDTRWS